MRGRRPSEEPGPQRGTGRQTARHDSVVGRTDACGTAAPPGHFELGKRRSLARSSEADLPRNKDRIDTLVETPPLPFECIQVSCLTLRWSLSPLKGKDGTFLIHLLPPHLNVFVMTTTIPNPMNREAHNV